MNAILFGAIKRVGALVLLLLWSFTLVGQDVTGVWGGELIAGTAKIRVVFHIDRSETGYVALMDSPDQGARGIPVSAVILDGANLSIEIESLGAIYKGILMNDDLIDGSLSQMGMSFPLSLTKDKQEILPVSQRPEVVILSDDILGVWNGEFAYSGANNKLALDIGKTSKEYTISMYNFGMGVQKFPVSSFVFDTPELSMEIMQLGFVYKGVVVNDTLIDGSFTQMGMTFPLSLVKSLRPQEPKQPFSYKVEDVSFSNEKAGAVFAGTVTTPVGEGPFPAVVLVSGSGAQNRDEEYLGHKPFLLIADHLTRNGIAVLRYDDRGFGESTGSRISATTEDYMEDALCAFEYLSKRPDIDKKRVGIIGHSEGGTISFMAAARNKEIAFIISLAGGAVKGDMLLAKQNYDILIALGISEEAASVYSAAIEEIGSVIDTRPYSDIVNNFEEIEEELFKDKRDILPANLMSNLSQILRGGDVWLRFFIGNDPKNDIKNVSCPVFALNGSKDIQVDAEMNLSAVETYLKTAGNTNFTVRKYDGLNHMFQRCETGGVLEYSKIEETMSPEVLEDIKNWILKTVK